MLCPEPAPDTHVFWETPVPESPSPGRCLPHDHRASQPNLLTY